LKIYFKYLDAAKQKDDIYIIFDVVKLSK
jgi:hypothetical protein